MKEISLRQARDLPTICTLSRDNYSVGDWTIMTDGYTVWISKQKLGHPCTAEITVPKKVFDRLLMFYERPQRRVRQ